MYTLMKFGASWCGPCRQLAKELKENPINIPDVNLLEIDVDEDETTSDIYNITSVPALLLKNDNNEIIYQHIGYIPINQLYKEIQEVINE